MSEVVTSLADPSANVIFGAVIDDQVGWGQPDGSWRQIRPRLGAGPTAPLAGHTIEAGPRRRASTHLPAPQREGGVWRAPPSPRRRAALRVALMPPTAHPPRALPHPTTTTHCLQYEGEIHVTIIATGFSQTFEENLWGGKSSTVSAAGNGNGRPVPVQQAAPQQQMPPPQLRQLQQQAARAAEPARPVKRGWW